MGLRSSSLAALACLLAIGLFAASPFYNKGLVGTGESFNYSLSVADAVTQMRHGVLPPLAGQTEYAFNGRIHPLRNAPYLHYLCAAIDVATLRRLPFWQLQNLSLIFSLFAALFGCYGGLRWATGCPRPLAVVLASVYGLAPPLLSAAFTFDLYMTVHAAAFVPLALAAAVRGARSPSFSADAWLAAALAGAWLAHPPVALWLTVSSVVVRLVAFPDHPRFGVVASGLLSAVLGGFLACFVFASAATLGSEMGYFASNPQMWDGFADIILNGLRSNAAGSLLPVSAGAGSLADLQLGYVSWVLLALVSAAVLRKAPPGENGPPYRLAAAGCAVAALVLLVLDLPVPFVTHFAWQHMPSEVLELTTQWPMQRLYLVAVCLCVYGAGTILPRCWASLGAPRWLAPAAVAAALGWVLYQARPFIKRGYGDRIAIAETDSSYRPSNLDLTITSYAFFGPPPTYVHGVMDPQFEFRVLRDGKDEVASPLAAGLATAPVVQSGALRLPGGLARGKTVVSPKLTLLPGHRYLLGFAFRIPPVSALISIQGSLLHRGYILPEAGQNRGFGMMDGERRAIPIWTDSTKPEQVEIRVWFTDQAAIEGHPTVFADYTLQDVAMDTLPVRLESLLPLRFTVDAPQAGCTVETPRRYLPGYEATVNGKPAIPIMSPYRQVMIPIPAGRSIVELRYPGPLLAREAFWLCALSWLAFWSWRAFGSKRPVLPWARAARPFVLLWQNPWAALATVAMVALCAAEFTVRERSDRFSRAVGPMRITFQLPYGKARVNEPLLSTGHERAGVVVFAHIIDERHISVGADVWGSLFQSGPIELDYAQPHTIVVSHGGLYPKGNPRLERLSPEEVEALRGALVIELDGKPVIREIADCFESTIDEIHVGSTAFGSMTPPQFDGKILSFGRLPIPQELMLPGGYQARMRVQFPVGREGVTEPLLSVNAGPNSCECSATYLSASKLKLSLLGSDGATLLSRVVRYDSTQVHELEFAPAARDGAGSGIILSCTFDGAHVLGPSGPSFKGFVPVLQSALNSPKVPGVEERFTGPRMEISLLSHDALPRGNKPWGAAEFVVSFPGGKPGRQEPLLTTGTTGAGDFIYVIYVDSHHIRIGFDHWGGGAGLISGPLDIDYRVPHQIAISMAPLYPDPEGDPLWLQTKSYELQKLRSEVRVALDGKTVISLPATLYPATPNQVTFFENRIGGSTADPKFTGITYFLTRIPPSSAFP